MLNNTTYYIQSGDSNFDVRYVTIPKNASILSTDSNGYIFEGELPDVAGPTGPAGGDLRGTYPDPVVSNLTGLPADLIAMDTNTSMHGSEYYAGGSNAGRGIAVGMSYYNGVETKTWKTISEGGEIVSSINDWKSYIKYISPIFPVSTVPFSFVDIEIDFKVSLSCIGSLIGDIDHLTNMPNSSLKPGDSSGLTVIDPGNIVLVEDTSSGNKYTGLYEVVSTGTGTNGIWKRINIPNTYLTNSAIQGVQTATNDARLMFRVINKTLNNTFANVDSYIQYYEISILSGDIIGGTSGLGHLVLGFVQNRYSNIHYFYHTFLGKYVWIVSGTDGTNYAEHIPENYEINGEIKQSAWKLLLASVNMIHIATGEGRLLFTNSEIKKIKELNMSNSLGSVTNLALHTNINNINDYWTGICYVNGSWVSISRDLGYVIKTDKEGIFRLISNIYVNDVERINPKPTLTVSGTGHDNIWSSLVYAYGKYIFVNFPSLAGGGSDVTFAYSTNLVDFTVLFKGSTDTVKNFYNISTDGTQLFTLNANAYEAPYIYKIQVNSVSAASTLVAEKGMAISEGMFLLDNKSARLLGTNGDGMVVPATYSIQKVLVTGTSYNITINDNGKRIIFDSTSECIIHLPTEGLSDGFNFMAKNKAGGVLKVQVSGNSILVDSGVWYDSTKYNTVLIDDAYIELGTSDTEQYEYVIIGNTI